MSPRAQRIRGSAPAPTQEIESHGMSAFGDLAYPADFHHFSYVDPQRAEGRDVFADRAESRQFNQNFLTFNSLNSYILKGDAAQGMELTFATLMARSGDEPDAMYGLAAAKCGARPTASPTGSSSGRKPNSTTARQLTRARCRLSLNTLKEKGHPLITQSLRDFIGAKAEDDDERRRHLRAATRPRRAAFGRRLADFFARLLLDKAVRGIDARRSARLGRLQGRPLRAPAASSNMSA